ncbi:hypothetical protein [Algicola sagamiensis]|uniref:hypothetical protein n=1 Tax=Algicola sagamiensis TaxID=163869 RepID=UPI0003824F1F|nr:hypothetical protein [Algicola sagamiensis]
MKCPKCQFEQPDHSEKCPSCGIYFAKYFQHFPQQSNDEEDEWENEFDDEPLHWWERFLYPGESHDTLIFYIRIGILVIMVLWGFSFILDSPSKGGASASFLHNINLPFHEAGHIVFRPFGQFMTSLGGTLGQLLIPFLCLATFSFKYLDNHSATVCLWWFGQNFIDIAPYINDARAGQLPLLGGNFGHSSPYGFHDWEYILTESGLIAYDQGIAIGSHFFGAIIMILAMIWAGILLYKQYQWFQTH